MAEFDNSAGSLSVRARVLVCVFLGFAVGWKVHTIAARHAIPSDFEQVWIASRAVLARQNPYPLIGPGRAFEWPWPLFYPLPAAVAAIPLAPLSSQWSGAVFMALSAGCFAWALTERGAAPLLGLLSAPMIMAIESVQWAPLLAASFVLAPIGIFDVAKPTIGAALFVARPTRWPIIGGAVLTAIAFALQPAWLSDWHHAFAPGRSLRPLHFTAPVLQPGGFLLLATALRWRRPEARLLLALSCVPQTLIMYEALPLFLVPESVLEVTLLVILSYATQVIAVLSSAGTDMLFTGGRWLIALYLCAAVMVLRRPNLGPLPEWLERRIVGWPSWLRGVQS